jgi:hypothetical protein
MSGSGVPARRSLRSNIGVPPERFGNLVPSNQRKAPARRSVPAIMSSISPAPSLPDLDGPYNNHSQQQSRMNEDIASVRSQRSHGSVSSSIRKLSGRLEVREKLFQLKKQRSALQMELDQQRHELKIAEAKLLSFMNEAIPEDEEQRQQHMAALKRYRDDVESKKLCYNHGESLFNTKVSDIEEEKAMILYAEQTREEIADLREEEEQNLGSINGDTYTHREPLEKVKTWQNQTKPVVAVAEEQTDAATVSTLMRRQVIKHDLPAFDGKYDEWPIFFSQYQMTTKACKLTDVENIQRLQKSLRGEARAAVKSMLVSPNNLDRVMKILQKRYGKSKYILDTIFQQVESLPSLKGHDKKGLINFADAVRNLTSTAVAFDCQPYLSNPRLLGNLVKKLPDFRQASWCHYGILQGSDFPSLQDFSDWLEGIGDEVEFGYDPLDDNKEKNENFNGKPLKKDKVFAANDEEALEKKCLFCKKSNHRVPQCQDFKKISVDDRWSWVKRQRCCFGCLNYGHSAKECKLKKPCGIDGCEISHHQLLHKSRMMEQTQINPIKYCSGSVVNLMVVPVTVMGPKRNVKTFAMLDTGSTLTLLDGSLAREVGIRGDQKPLQFERISGSDQDATSEVISVRISASNGEEFQLTYVRTIAKLPLPRQSVRRSK